MILFVVCWVGALPASAGMVKYRMPDGKEGYASPDRIPPGAKVEDPNYQPDGSLTRDDRKKRDRTREATAAAAPTSTPKREAALATSMTAEERRAALARDRWQRKAESSRTKLEKAERNVERWRARCGIEEDSSDDEPVSSCSTYERGQLDAAMAALEEAEEWAEDGLYDACRRDEYCLPGYIR